MVTGHSPIQICEVNNVIQITKLNNAPPKQDNIETLPNRRLTSTVAIRPINDEIKPFGPDLSLHYPLLAFLYDSVSIVTSLIVLNYLNTFEVITTGSVKIPPIFTIFIGISLLWLTIFSFHSLYLIQKSKYQWSELSDVVQSVIISFIMTMGVLYLLDWQISRMQLLQQAVLVLAFSVGWRLLYHTIKYVNFIGLHKFHRRVLVVGSQERISSIVTTLQQVNPEYIEIVGFVTNANFVSFGEKLGNLDIDFQSLIKEHNISDIVTGFTHQANASSQRFLDSVLNLPVNVYTLPDYMDVDFFASPVNTIDQTNLVNITLPSLNKFDLFLKRIFDIILSSIAIVLVAPIIAVIALLIKLEDGGPILFVQNRMGHGKKKFRIFKFRSMRIDADKELESVSEKDDNGRIINHKHPDDPRITHIGKLIRRTSLDEIPQIFNVLRGDMTLVGPRPEILRLVEEYEPWQNQRFFVKQGITGWWQVNGRSKTPCHLSTHQDIEYIKQFSFLLDVQIMLMTIPALLKGKGAF